MSASSSSSRGTRAEPNPWSNISRCSGEFDVIDDGAHHSTTWHFARVTRDVEQPQFLVAVLPVALDDVLAIIGPALAAHVEYTLVLRVVQQRRHRVRRAVLRPRVRHVDDRVLEALAHVDRRDLHGRGVALEPPGPVGADAGFGVVDALGEPAVTARTGPGSARPPPG